MPGSSPPSSRPVGARVVEGAGESLLVLSDVHLGSDLVSYVRRASTAPRRSDGIDRDLVALLAHYRERAPLGTRWRLVVAGDLVDFVGIAIGPEGEALATPASDEERVHGLGSAADHAVIKLRRVAERHAAVFDALAAFVAAGHALTLIVGNHDLELHWDDVKAEMRRQLLSRAALDGAEAEAAFDARVGFEPWFFWREGVAYIEHGHPYDAFCSSTHVMAPESPLDARRIARGFSDVLLRFVVHPTAGLGEHGHESLGIFDYVRFAGRLGVRGMLALGRRYVRAIVELFRVRREWLGESARALAALHERRMAAFAEARRIGLEKLRAVASMHALPVTGSVRGILASLLVDRLALGVGCVLALVALGVVALWNGHVLFAALPIAIAWPLVHRRLAADRKIDPRAELVTRAGELARLFPAAFVVMGHTHEPSRVALDAANATYLNVGAWDEDEPDAGAAEGAARAPRTHLVIRRGEAGPIAELLAWDAGAPRPFGERHDSGGPYPVIDTSHHAATPASS